MRPFDKNIPLKIGIVGAGYIATTVHLPILSRMPEVQVTSICDLDIDRASKVAAHFRIENVFSNPEEMLGEKIDLIDVCTPPQTHAEIVLRALENGSNCVVEKPMALSLAEAESIIKKKVETGKDVFALQAYSAVPALLRAKSIIEMGDIGHLVDVDIRYFHTFDDHRHKDFLSPNHWVHGMPGDVFGDIAPHFAFMLVDFIGRAESVKAVSKKLSDHPHIPADELKVIVASKGAVGAFTLSFNSPIKHLSIDLVGTRGGLYVDGDSQAVVRYGPIKDSGDILGRGLRASNDIFQRVKNLVAVGTNVLLRRYTPLIQGHAYLFRSCSRSLRQGENYPIDLGKVRDSIELLQTAFGQIE